MSEVQTDTAAPIINVSVATDGPHAELWKLFNRLRPRKGPADVNAGWEEFEKMLATALVSQVVVRDDSGLQEKCIKALEGIKLRSFGSDYGLAEEDMMKRCIAAVREVK